VNIRRLIPPAAAIRFLIVVAFIGYLYVSREDLVGPESLQIPASAYLSPFGAETPETVIADTTADISQQLDRLSLDQQDQTLVNNGQLKQMRTKLLEIAALAVQENDKNKLGNIMLLLGKVATNEMEFGVAEAYLQEALEIALQSGNTLAEANTYQQLGKLHIRTRELARIAGIAYENLWLVKNQMYLGEYRLVEENLRQIVDTSIAVQRYGAAAHAYETLAKFHRGFHDNFQAQSASLEAAKLYASSGQLDRSQQIVNSLEQEAMEPMALDLVKTEIADLYEQHQNNLKHNAQAREYQMLYQYYNSKGEVERAWKLRILASKSLASTSERSMYSRQADVMAILYNSNFAMDKARGYLDQASNLFAIRGEDDSLASARDMQSLIY
jgi:hypothetical protein